MSEMADMPKLPKIPATLGWGLWCAGMYLIHLVEGTSHQLEWFLYYAFLYFLFVLLPDEPAFTRRGR